MPYGTWKDLLTEETYQSGEAIARLGDHYIMQAEWITTLFQNNKKEQQRKELIMSDDQGEENQLVTLYPDRTYQREYERVWGSTHRFSRICVFTAVKRTKRGNYRELLFRTENELYSGKNSY